MKHLSIITMALLGFVVINACNKDKRLLYQQDPRVYFYESQVHRDSLNYTFATEPFEKQTDTAYIVVRIMGEAMPKDRIVQLIAADSSTAKAGRDYDFGPLIVHANKYEDSLPVYLHKTEAMKDSVFQLYLAVGESEDFKPGYTDNGTSLTGGSRLNYRISVTDQLTKPSRWSSYTSWFGTYSTVKFQFMILSTGKTDWESTIYPAELNYLAQQVKQALVVYEQANGPLIDEFGNTIVFP